jgi:hypothetical protein
MPGTIAEAQMRHKAEHSFKTLTLTEGERLWLTEVYRRDFDDVDSRSLRIALSDRLPSDFSPKSLQEKYLIYGEHISLLGLWHVDPESRYLKAAETVIRCLRDILFQMPHIQSVSAQEIAAQTQIDERVVRIALMLILDLPGFLGGASRREDSPGLLSVSFPQRDEDIVKLIHFASIEDELEEFCARAKAHSRDYASESNSLMHLVEGNIGGPDTVSTQADVSGEALPPSKEVWKGIHSEFGVRKPGFGKKINFVTDGTERGILLRDVEQAYVLAKWGFCKPAVILAGGVIEQLLGRYLESKDVRPARNTFEGYIRACDDNALLQSAISRLSDSVRHFRNLVHIAKEVKEKQKVSKAVARSAVSTIFIVVDAF